MTTVRRATSLDAPELTRLREQMFGEMGRDVLAQDWQKACTVAFAERLGPDGDMAAFVVDRNPAEGEVADGGSGALLACAVGYIYSALPGPDRPDGRTGCVLNVATDTSARGRGHARATTTALLDWFHGYGVRRVEMHATPPVEALARSLGFTQLTSKALTWAERRAL